MLLSSINHALIKLALVSTLIYQQQSEGVKTFDDLVSTRPTDDNINEHHMVVDEFTIKSPVDKVFDHYVHANPSEAWSGGNLVQFGLALSKRTGEVFYPGQDYPGAEVGHVFYIHLNIWGMKKICMAQEIVEVDKANGVIIFSYVKGGKTNGMQEIRFVSQPDESTKIIHTSYFKGVSPFRDKYLYPYFHGMVVAKFHENLAKSIV